MSRDIQHRETFSHQTMFILASIGSAVGLGNIWRFPYIAYANGGGSFLIPYLTALLTAGLPLLLLEYALGHRFRGSGPLSFRRLNRFGEIAGWLQVGVAFMIALFYPVIIAWSARYLGYSIHLSWGKDASRFFSEDFLQAENGFSLHFLPQILIPLLIVWAIVIVIMILGVKNGIGKLSSIFVPLLIVMFAALVVRALFLPGAAQGLQVLFTPDWEALSHPSVWIAAYGQIFFSLNVGFAIMITYSSYLKERSDLVGSGCVVAFANSSFEALAGIGVFATLGFLATTTGQQVQDVTANGIGLAFIAFPAIISQMPGGPLFGVVFFFCLTIAGITSEIAIVEVCISALRDKFGLVRWSATLAVTIPLLLGSILLFSTTTGSQTLDIFDKFVCSIGIVTATIVSMLLVVWVFRALPQLRNHLNTVSSLRVGRLWTICVAFITPLALFIIISTEISTVVQHGYGDYPQWMLLAFGWTPLIIIVVGSIILTLLPWSRETSLLAPPRIGELAVADPTAAESERKEPSIKKPGNKEPVDDKRNASDATQLRQNEN